MSEEEEKEVLLDRGVKYLNYLSTDWEDRNLQEMLSAYHKCHNDISQLRKAVAILGTLRRYVLPGDVERMREIVDGPRIESLIVESLVVEQPIVETSKIPKLLYELKTNDITIDEEKITLSENSYYTSQITGVQIKQETTLALVMIGIASFVLSFVLYSNKHPIIGTIFILFGLWVTITSHSFSVLLEFDDEELEICCLNRSDADEILKVLEERKGDERDN